MGLPASGDSSDANRPQVVPIRAPEPSTITVTALHPAQPELEEYGRRVGELLGRASKTINRVYARARVRVSDTRSGAASRTGEIGSPARFRAERLKEDRPLQLLGIIAGIAFAAGVATRVLRSRYRE
jgi:hypothetical protein